MVYKVEQDLDDFDFWGAARQTKDIVVAYDDEHNTNHWDQICEYADEIFNEGENYTATDVNDWVAFDVPNMLDESWSEVFDE